MSYFDAIEEVLNTRDYVYIKLSDGSTKVIVDVTTGLAVVDASEFSAFSFSFTEDYEDLFEVMSILDSQRLEIVAIR